MYDAKHDDDDDDDMKKKKKKQKIRKRSSSRRYEKLPYVLHVHYTSLQYNFYFVFLNTR